MSKKVKVDPNQKEFLVLKFKELNISLSEFCRIYNVERTAIIRWSIKYELGGKDALFEITNKTLYSAHTLINSVTDYLSGNFSMLDIVKKYNLSGDSVLRNWLKWYNTPKWNIKVVEFMAREKISKSFKLNLVSQFLQQNLSVKEIANINSISEGQLRDWIRRYKASGEEALEDNRGNKKSEEFLSNEEILKRKNKELEEKKVYMCTTLDLYDRSILSCSISTRATLELALETLRNSYQEKSNEKRILHSDRGCQFTSYEYKRELERLGITHSMSRVGKCMNNGPMEGFWGNLKVEKYY